MAERLRGRAVTFENGMCPVCGDGEFQHVELRVLSLGVRTSLWVNGSNACEWKE